MEALWQDVKETLKEIVTSETLRDGEIVAIGISGTCCSSWLLDAEGRPVRNAILWNDGRAADIIGEWQRSGVMDELFRISGNTVFPGYTVAVLRWLQRNEPEALEKARWSVFCKDWICYCLTGEIVSEHSDVGYTPYDIRESVYSDELLELCGVEAMRRLFPNVLEPGDVAGHLLPEVAEEVGLPTGIPVVAGMVDVTATTLGAGAYKPGQATTIVGTAFLNNFVTEQPSFEPFGIGVQTRTAGGVWVRSVINTSGTISLEWFLDQFCANEREAAEAAGRSIYEWAERVAGEVPLGSGGIIYHPYLNTTGVIAPFLNPTARAQFFGISIENTRADMLRAVYEGTALAMLDCSAQIPVEIEEWYISGGGKRSAFWCQMFSDCTGRTILVPTGDELGARGVAVLAGIACGIYRDLDDAMKQVIRVERRHEPNPEATEKYQQIYELYKKIYEHVMDDWWERHRLLSTLGE
jgi:xylulokinase/L-xylulokinase